MPTGHRAPKANSIDFDHVRFALPRRCSETRFLDVTLARCQHGTTVALGGTLGRRQDDGRLAWCRASGTRSEGAVRIGGVDVRDIPSATFDGAAWRSCSRTSGCSSGALADNIRAARPDATTRRRWRPPRTPPSATTSWRSSPRGWTRVVGAKGVYLSGGECQRIALARAILKDAPIVVLDEATAFADPENEALIQRALADADPRQDRAHDRASAVHRWWTPTPSCVLEGGRLVERGTHADLVAAGGLYARMWDDYRTSATWRIEGGKGAGDAA